jgi:hypothetical protein
VYRAAGGTLLLLCVLVSGFLLHDRLGGEKNAGNLQQRPEIPAPVVVPTPAPPPVLVPGPAPAPIVVPTPALPVEVTPELPEVAETDQTAGPRHDRRAQQADGARQTHVRASNRNRRVEPPALRWESATTLESEPPRWRTP